MLNSNTYFQSAIGPPRMGQWRRTYASNKYMNIVVLHSHNPPNYFLLPISYVTKGIWAEVRPFDVSVEEIIKSWTSFRFRL